MSLRPYVLNVHPISFRGRPASNLSIAIYPEHPKAPRSSAVRPCDSAYRAGSRTWLRPPSHSVTQSPSHTVTQSPNTPSRPTRPINTPTLSLLPRQLSPHCSPRLTLTPFNQLYTILNSHLDTNGAIKHTPRDDHAAARRRLDASASYRGRGDNRSTTTSPLIRFLVDDINPNNGHKRRESQSHSQCCTRSPPSLSQSILLERPPSPPLVPTVPVERTCIVVVGRPERNAKGQWSQCRRRRRGQRSKSRPRSRALEVVQSVRLGHAP